MTKAEARMLAKKLHRGGTTYVRIVEWIDDGNCEILVQYNDVTLSTVEDVESYMQRNGAG